MNPKRALLTLLLAPFCPLLAMDGKPSKEVEKADTWDGKHYRANSSRQFQFAQKLLYKELHDKSLAMGEFLDAGCGTGDVAAWIATEITPKSRIHCVDKSESMIKEAKAHYGRHSQLTFETADITDLPYHNRFDLAWSCATFLWVKNHQKALNSLSRALKIDGKVIISSTGKLPDNHTWYKAAAALAQKPEWAILKTVDLKGQTTPIEPITFYPMMKNAGFGGAGSMLEISNTSEYETEQDFKNFVKGFVGGFEIYKKLPAAMQESFLQEVTTAYIENGGKNAAGRIEYVLPVVVVQFKKISEPLP